MENKINYKLLNFLIILCITFIGIKTFYLWGEIGKEIFSILFPFLLSFIMAYSLYPIVRMLKKIGVRNNIAIISVILVVTCIFVLLFYITIPLIFNQLSSIVDLIKEFIDIISVKYNINLSKIELIVESPLNGLIKKVGSYISLGMINIFTTSIELFTKTIVSIVVAVYLLFDMENIRTFISRNMVKKNKKIYKLTKKIDEELTDYLGGILIFMLIQLIEYSVAFLLIGHPNWLILAILASLTTVIPYFGAFATNMFAVLLSAVISKKLFFLTVIVCILLPNIDGYIISPKVFGKTNNINPVVSIVLTVISAKLFGIIGILLCIPTYIIFKNLFTYYLSEINRTKKIKV